MKNKFLEIIKKKWLKNITLTILLFAIIICAYVAVIYGMSKVNISDLDFTKDKVYSISEATKDKLKNLDEDITIYLYNMYEDVNDFANKYTNVNSHIKVEKLENLNANTAWKTKYGVTEENNFLVVQAKEKEKILYESDLYTVDYTTYEQIDTKEEAITNAILDIITTVKPKIYFLTGHNLYADTYFQSLQTAITEEANTVENLDLRTKGKIPEDCKVLVLTMVKEDLTIKERDLILNYIKNGGELLLLIDPNLGQIKIPNFNKVLNEYGIESVSDGFILEGDANKMMSGAPNFVVSTINSSSEIVKNINMDLNAFLINPAKITFLSDEELEKRNVTKEVLATVSDKAFYRTDLQSNSKSKISSDKDAAGEVVSAMLTKQNGENNVSKMIIFSNTAFATNMSIQLDAQYYMYAIDGYNNKDVLLNSISYLTEREDNITIRKNIETVSTYDVTDMQITIVLIIIIAIPVLIIIVGIIIWQLRRRKK